MHNDSLTWPAGNKEYYNPVSKIRALIKNLDAELMQLCGQSKSAAVVISNSAPTNFHLVRKSSAAIPKVPSNVKPFVIKPGTKAESNSSYGNNNNSNNTNANVNSNSNTNQKPQTPRTRKNNHNQNNNHNISRMSVTRSTNTTGTALMSSVSQTAVPIKQLANIYRSRVIEAYRNRRIFTVYGNYHTVRRALLQRGWLEKLAPGRHAKLQNLPEEVLLTHAKKGNDYEQVVISKIINHFPPFFIWQPKGQRDYAGDVRPYRNRIRRNANLDFSTKVGLIGCAELEEWYSQEGLSRLSHPRFYRLNGSAEERMAFIDDFRFTQSLSMLRYVAENVKTLDLIHNEEQGTVPLSVVAFAITQVKLALNETEHVSIDTETENADEGKNKDSGNEEWNSFISSSYLVLRNRSKFKGSQRELAEYARAARGLVDRIERKYPDHKWDGIRNLWILKPGYQSRGIGIIIRSSLDEILQWTSNNFNRRYIAQKYIERPLLIYKTKFDIRQYMLLSIGAVHVNVWLYRDCYLRFSSQEYTIDDLRESIHLTNNSVQKRYKNKQNRDPRLPKHNMWSLDQFKAYLKDKEESSDIWETRTFPGIKQSMIAVVLASLEETDFVENAFELYGCDFMLDEDYNPILIEINSTPDLTPSTEVTARICPNVLRDTVRVVVDLPRNPKAAVGMFEKAFEVNYKISRDFDPNQGLNVTGTKMTLFQPIPSLFRPRFWRRIMKSPRTERNQKKPKRVSDANGRNRQSEISKRDILSNKKQEKPQIRHHKTTVPPGESALVLSTKFEEFDNSVPLSTIEKEALALRYTHPK